MTPHIPFSDFLTQLFDTGTVTVAPALLPIPEHEQAAGVQIIRSRFEVLSLDYPADMPDFDADAALWAGQWVYYAVHLMVIRDAGEAEITRLMPPYSAAPSPSAVISADVCLSYLPEILHAAKGFAPGDILVTTLKTTARSWPFSAAGLALEGLPDIRIFSGHPALMQIYTDRLIQYRQRERLRDPLLAPWLQHITGNYSEILTP